eukprot:TRINITY_DN12054_c0_g1_i1.p1 TRINITY_DN12054_c0_g1~~TRINITY_DN12054_c0_g1_i1.p1  ORF type:complete len:225 (-),score=28.88 TRINITY_DN12054_c0_g1_i1:168-842(-)
MPMQYGSNGLNPDGSCMNVGNKLAARPSIKLFPQYSSGAAMISLLTDEAMGFSSPTGSDAPHSPVRPPAPDSPANRIKASRTASPLSSAALSPAAVGSSPIQSPANRIRASMMPEAVQPAPSPVGASPAVIDEFAQRRLYDGARDGRYKDVCLAVQRDGALINEPNRMDGDWTALHYAAYGGHGKIVRFLLAQPGVDPRRGDVSGQTPEMLAAPELKELFKPRI